MFEALVRYDCLFGQVDHLAEFTAVATWMRPGETAETSERLAAAGFDDLPAEVPLARLDAFFSTIGPAHERAPPEPHWYLRLLGVDPAHHGQGLGSTLLEHGLRRADETSQPCYLETFAERNVHFYLRHGFELVVDETEPFSGIRTWASTEPKRTRSPRHPPTQSRSRESALPCASVQECSLTTIVVRPRVTTSDA